MVFKGGIFINEVVIILAIVCVLMLIIMIAMCQISGKISKLEDEEYFINMLNRKDKDTIDEENSEVS